ncbi:protein kinase [Streptomyces sp. NPDC002896]|uniref:serine/threonine-protein kinase n=1 Tax=Streptomyces sp. NPDC002896 TaxID=3154438 RepID=UPI00331765EB
MTGETSGHGRSQGQDEDQDGRGLIAGRYRLMRRLGTGGMAMVWLAYDEELASEVAVKEIAVPEPGLSWHAGGEGGLDREMAARVARARAEARNAARLRSHPHVATVYDVVQHEGLPWIVMEYVPGATDADAVVRAGGPMSSTDTARIGIAVLDALVTGHRLGILHRDVKPANILLAPGTSDVPGPGGGAGTGAAFERVLLTDYGISLRPASGDPRLTAAGGVIGTPGYLSPERARGGTPTAEGDLFSLGATLYRLVEGEGPFARDSDLSTLTAVLFEDPPPPRRASTPLATVLLGLLEKDPERRMTGPDAERVLREAVSDGPARSPFGGGGGARVGLPQPPVAGPPVPPPLALPAAGAAPQRKRRVRAYQLGLAAAAVVGAVWGGIALADGIGGDADAAASASPSESSGSHPYRPYRNNTTLDQELVPGECVNAVWENPKKPYTGEVQMWPADCGISSPAGQVIAVEEVADPESLSATQARRTCEKRTAELRKTLAAPVAYPMLPSADGSTLACLVFQRGSDEIYGSLGEFRKEGEHLAVTNAGTGDCFNVDDRNQWLLTNCDKPHSQQAIGWAKAPDDMSYDEFRKASPNLCQKKFGEAWVRGTSRVIAGWYTADGDRWNGGFRYLMCALRNTDTSKKLPGGAAEPVEG